MIPEFTNAPIAKYWPQDRPRKQLYALQKAGVNTLGDVMRLSNEELLLRRIPDCGIRTANTLKKVLVDGMKEYLEEVS